MKNRYLLMFLVSIICCPAFSTHAQSAFEKFKASAAMDKSDLKLPPTNAFEFLQNIKHAIDTELFLDDSFFEPENLLLFTNAKSVDGIEKNGDWLTIKQANIEGVQRSIEVTKQNTEEKKTGRMAISFFSKLIDADFITKVFGPISKTIELSKKFAFGHPIPLSAKTHPLGNTEACQTFVNKKTYTEICSLVSGNGQVGQFYVVQTREK